MKTRFLIIFLLLVLFGGCAVFPSHIENPLLRNFSKPATAAIQVCAELFIETEQAITAAGVVDSQAARIPGYPYLRVNRFLSSYRNEITDETFDAWIDLMQNLAMEGWTAEIANLSAKEKQKPESFINNGFLSGRPLIQTLEYCSYVLREHDLINKTERDALREAAVVPPEYQTWKRVVGLYPLTALAFRSGIYNWHKETLEAYRSPLKELPVHGELVRYVPLQNTATLSANEVALILEKSSGNPLNIPLPAYDDMQRLFDHYAPIFEIDVAVEDDRLGAPVWQGDEFPLIDTSKPMVYRHLSHTRIGDRTLLQLNYTIWFPSRPLGSAFDLLGGHLDGITWRVTLLPNGNPWLYDSIHNCGCYHLFFPTQSAKVMVQESTFAESAFIPQQVSTDTNAGHPVLRIASTTHYIQRVYFETSETTSIQTLHYQWAEADSLRSLPRSDGNRRSLFGQDGIVAGSERSERYLFWPMGIPEPGAMRQWGHHATAFVGRRHFDDPRLFETIFEIIEFIELDNSRIH